MLAVVADFDGTILKNDLPELALKKFGLKGWEHYDELLTAGAITLEECVSRQYGMINARSREEIIEYLDGFCDFRQGAEQLLSECRSRGIKFMVVSAGLDFCIEHAFKAAGLRLPQLVCPKSSFIPGKGFRLTFPNLHSAASRDFKEDLVAHRKKMGERVVFVGDGAGDLYAAIKADVRFAIRGSALDRMCAEREIPHRRIKTLFPVQESARVAKAH
jgi:HAD superfamily phosphoserine phosphatase-like hydrolase